MLISIPLWEPALPPAKTAIGQVCHLVEHATGQAAHCKAVLHA